MELQESFEEIRGLGAAVWVIANDDPERLRSFQQQSGIVFPILLDIDSAVIARYGILNEEDGTIPHPAALITDRQGVLRYAFVEPDYEIRPPARALIEVLRALDR